MGYRLCYCGSMATAAKAPKRRGTRGEGSVYPKTIERRKTRADGSVNVTTTDYWVADVPVPRDVETGKGGRKLFYCKGKAEAMALLLAHVGQQREAPPAPTTRGEVDRQKLRLADFLIAWADEAQVTPGTTKSYKQTLTLHVIPYVGNLRLTEFDGKRALSLYRDLKDADVSASMIQRVHRTLKTALNTALKSSSPKEPPLLKANPLATIDAPRYKTPPVESLTAPQAKTLLAAVKGNRLGATIVLALTSGLRQGEVFAARWGDIDGTRMHVRRSLREVGGHLEIAETKTAAGLRVFTLTAAAIDALKERAEIAKREGHGSEYIFTTPHGQLLRKTNFATEIFEPLREKAGLPKSVHFHTLRHTAASLHLQKGTNPKAVQALLGHANITTTLGVYGHLLPGEHDAAAATMDGILGD